MEYITYDEFKKMDIRIGTIREIEPISGADKLLKCQIDFGVFVEPIIETIEPIEQLDGNHDGVSEDNILTDTETAKLDNALEQINVTTEPKRDIRQIISGIREYYPDYEELIGKQVLYIVNLEPRTIRGHVSHGMLMAVGGDKPVFLIPDEPVEPGSRVR